jgi:hypothetical protein
VIRVCGLVTIASEVTAGVLDVTMSFHDCVVLFKLALPRSCALHSLELFFIQFRIICSCTV